MGSDGLRHGAIGAENDLAAADPGTYGVAPPGYRLPAAARVGRVSLQIANADRSLRYYEQFLGFRVLSRTGGVTLLGAEGGPTPLIELHEAPGARAVAPRGRLGLYHFAILLPDRAALGRFIQHVGESGTRVGASDHLVSEALYLRDPDGLGIEVYVDRPRETWLRHGRELVMATNPLDMAAVAHAAGRTRWSGMPAGTTIGHVHLHVGDLERSAAFYHAGLGLDRVVWSYPGALFLSAGGYHHHLGTNTWAGPGASGPAQDEAQLLDWEFVLPGEGDVSAAVRSLEAFGYAAGRAERGWVVPDPWGTRVRLIAAAS